MNKDELILKGKHKVRGSSDLMLIYIDLFKQQFGYKPNCAGCTFDNDWNRFVNGNASPKAAGMLNEVTTYELKKHSSDIVYYKIDGDKKIYRSRLNRMSEEYAVAFLTYGTPEQIEQRKKLFTVLPKAING